MLLRSVLALGLLLAVPPAHAHHRQTPPIVAITVPGAEGALPRLAPPSRKAAAVNVDDTIAVVSPFREPTTPTFTFAAGTNANPTISSNGRTVAWDTNADPLASGAPGRQVIRSVRFALTQPVVDPSGTSANPALDLLGLYVAFESTADLAGTGNAGARQVFLRRPDGSVLQLSRGAGSSVNAAVGRKGNTVVFESTSDPGSGVDTGVAQIWLLDVVRSPDAAPITAGAGRSRAPSLSNDGRLVVFESEADLAGDGHDTGTPQIFAYDTRSRTYARLTNDPTGCTAATSARIKRDWRVAYLCGGTPYFSMLRANARFRVQADGGDTTRIVPQADAHFMLVATSANLLAGGATPEHRVYMVNLYARPPEPAPSAIVWFPSQGIPPL